MSDLAALAPLYARIAAAIEEDIRAGIIAIGAKIPSEHDLAERFQVGRPTVRQATQMLVSEGLLERRRGSGTYVKGPEPRLDLFSAGSTLGSLSASGLASRTRVVRGPHPVTPPPELPLPWDGALEGALLVERVSATDKAPVLFEQLYFRPRVFPDLGQIDIQDRSLSALAADHYQLTPTHLQQSFRVVLLSDAQAEALGLDPGAPALLLERVLEFGSVGPAVCALLYCRTDQASLVQSVELGRSGSEARLKGGSHAAAFAPLEGTTV